MTIFSVLLIPNYNSSSIPYGKNIYTRTKPCWPQALCEQRETNEKKDEGSARRNVQ